MRGLTLDTSSGQKSRGQILVIFGATAVVLLLVTALVIDGGMAFAQRRNAQNGADLSAMAAVRIMASGGTDAQVVSIINSTAAANKATVLYGAANQGPQYLNASSVPTGWVAAGTIPSGSVGVRVPAKVTFSTYIARVVGINTWTASTLATARYKPALSHGGMFPFGISESSFDPSVAGHFTICPADQEPISRGGTCPDELLLEEPRHNLPGGFGWLKFGAPVGPSSKCEDFGLGMSTTSGCENDTGFLQGEIDGNSYGCCTAVGLPGSQDKIGKLARQEWTQQQRLLGSDRERADIHRSGLG